MSPLDNRNNSWALGNGTGDSGRTVGPFNFHSACWSLPEGCAILATDILNFAHIWLLMKQGAVTNLALNVQPALCMPCNGKVN